MMYPKNYALVLFFFCFQAIYSTGLKAQGNGGKGIVMMAEVINGDTFPVRYLPYVTIVETKRFKNDYERRRWERLKYNVKKVYPYAKLAGSLLDAVDLFGIGPVKTDHRMKIPIACMPHRGDGQVVFPFDQYIHHCRDSSRGTQPE